MLDGPCACGAWHSIGEFEDEIKQYGLSMTIELEFELGKLYSVPYADGMAHGILREVSLKGDDLIFKIQRPVGTIEVCQTLPRRRNDRPCSGSV